MPTTKTFFDTKGVTDSLDALLPAYNLKFQLKSFEELPDNLELECCFFSLSEELQVGVSGMSIYMSAEFKPPAEPTNTSDSFDYYHGSPTELQRTLLQAVCNADIAAVQAFIASSPPEALDSSALIWQSSSEEVSLLAVAASTGSEELLQLLLDSLSRVNVSKGYKLHVSEFSVKVQRCISPLQLACAKGFSRIVRTLLNAGADPNVGGVDYEQATTKDFGTPPLLIVANTRYHNSVLKLPGLKYKVVEQKGDYAACASLLIEAGAKVKIKSSDPLAPQALYSAYYDPELVRTLLASGADPNFANDKGQTPLYYYCEKTDNLEAIELLIKHGALLDPPTCRPLFIALSMRHIAVAKLLKSRGASINGGPTSPSALQVAVSANDPALVVLILSWEELEIDWLFRQNGKNMFHRIAQNKGYEVASLLLKNRSLTDLAAIKEALSQSVLDEWTQGDSTPLWFGLPYLSLVKLFVEFGADTSRLNLAKCCKVFRPDKELVQYLLQIGLQIEGRFDGRTALWMAYEEGRLDVMLVLAKAGANMDATDDRGLTPLQDACWRGFFMQAGLLLKHGANKHLRCYEGRDARDYTRLSYSKKTAEMRAKLESLLNSP
jgi:ankyrin repeat protein